jgi:hypothetical protein
MSRNCGCLEVIEIVMYSLQVLKRLGSHVRTHLRQQTCSARIETRSSGMIVVKDPVRIDRIQGQILEEIAFIDLAFLALTLLSRGVPVHSI